MDIVRADASHEAAILALASRTLGWSEDERFRALYRWKHDENAFGPSPRWVAVEDGAVVGFRVFLRWRFERGDNTTVQAVRAVDTATDPDHQGKGIFRALTTTSVDELRAEGVHFVFNTPNAQSRPGYLKMGWIDLGRPPIAMVPRLRSLPRIARSRAAADLWSTLTDVGRPARAYFEDPTVTDLLGAQRRDPGIWRTDRTPAFMAWRYGLPDLGYRVVDTDDLPGGARGQRGAAVFRLRRRGDATEATVADVLTTDPGTRRRLLRAVLRETGADYALVARRTHLDTTPAFSHASLSPMVTWRSLAMTREPILAHFSFVVGDLELF
ncbi:MAG: hypothetical protein JWM47_1016 [Acidimicrobiales bacterium]|nr:hypothetical protein [Acidimicrobiales bacterium]